MFSANMEQLFFLSVARGAQMYQMNCNYKGMLLILSTNQSLNNRVQEPPIICISPSSFSPALTHSLEAAVLLPTDHQVKSSLRPPPNTHGPHLASPRQPGALSPRPLPKRGEYSRADILRERGGTTFTGLRRQCMVILVLFYY